MIDQETRRLQFVHACDLLGGQREVARILQVSDRTVRSLCSGDSAIKQGFMREITEALYQRSKACNALARRTDPMFTANLTAAEIAALPAPTQAIARGENGRG